MREEIDQSYEDKLEYIFDKKEICENLEYE